MLYTEKDIDYIKDIIIEVTEPQRIILFGSYAYGKPEVSSDLDFLVVKEPEKGLSVSQSDELTFIKQINKKQREKGFFLPADIFILSNNDIADMKDDQNSALFHAVRKGRVLYETNDKKSRVV